MIRYDFLIVGAGLFGSTFAQIATSAGRKCLVVDKRDVAGGNLYCDTIESISVHKYGAHIFHTSDKRIWDFVNSFVEFNRYTNSPIANYKGKLYNLPFNMNTFHQFWGVNTPAEARAELDRQCKAAVTKMKANGITKPRNLEEQALSLVGEDIYKTLIKGYTEKQWGRKCSELPAFIIRRLPLRMTYDNNYFNDTYQGIPIEGGYNKLITKLLSKSEVKLGIDYLNHREQLSPLAKKIIYTGPIDRFFDYRYGALSYRSVKFSTEVLDTPNYQGNAVVNYTDADIPFTRIIEHKHFTSFGDRVYDNSKTVISREYSTEWTPESEPFYPVNDAENMELYRRYHKLAASLPDVIFAGRLAEYRYYDMDKVIARAFEVAHSLNLTR
ncbi:MAG: UDP-galactopyranose mutase [Muribaculaceae bacterium]